MKVINNYPILCFNIMLIKAKFIGTGTVYKLCFNLINGMSANNVNL